MKSLFRWSSLSFQLVGAMLSLTLGLGLIRTYLNRAEVEAFAREQFEQRSAATASAFAAHATDPVLTNDLFRLNELMNDTLLHNPDVRYIVVLDTNGRVLTQSFGRGVPRGLLAANRAAPNARYSLQKVSTDEGMILDIAVPLFEGKIGAVRVGMSERTMNADIDRHTFNLLLVTGLSLIPVFATAYLLARVLARPLEKLVAVTGAVARGDFTQVTLVAGQEEIAHLGTAFNAMTQALAQSQGELRASNAQLQQRNEELAALNALAAAISHNADLDALLTSALDKALEVMDVPVGWIVLSGNGTYGPRAWRGVDRAAQVAQAAACECARTDLADAHLAHEGNACPTLNMRHVIVPLSSREHRWGSLHLACADAHCFGVEQLPLLTAMGQQIGLAIENLKLAEQQQQAAFRRQLLDNVIDAQEEERKHIARELHDEFAQNLTALIVGLQTLEQSLTAEDTTRARLLETRTQAAQILDQTRRLIFDLRPTVLDDAGLTPALRSFAQRACEQYQLALDFQVVGTPRRLAAQTETALFRIVQEAVNNSVKHAHARTIAIRLRFDPAIVIASVQDDGVGFTAGAPLPARAIGLLGMLERAQLLGGHLDIESEQGKGTRVCVDIPIDTDQVEKN